MTPWSLWEQTGGLYQEDLVCYQESCNPRELYCEQEIQMLNSQHWELRGFHRYKPECPQAISEASHQGVQVGVGALSHALGYSRKFASFGGFEPCEVMGSGCQGLCLYLGELNECWGKGPWWEGQKEDWFTEGLKAH